MKFPRGHAAVKGIYNCFLSGAANRRNAIESIAFEKVKAVSDLKPEDFCIKTSFIIASADMRKNI